MKKKNFGFTLAEVLITLGIIGVVAALAAPALNSAVQKSKVGPSLRKFISTMEVANEHILQDLNADVLSSEISSIDDYYAHLSQFVKGSVEKDTTDKLEHKISQYDGTDAEFESSKIYTFSNGNAIALNEWEVSAWENTSNSSYKGQLSFGAYDINGFNTKPNRYGKDIFLFFIDNSGAIILVGGKQQYFTGSTTYKQGWKESSDKPCNEKEVIIGNTCAGSIADNDWKVIYKY